MDHLPLLVSLLVVDLLAAISPGPNLVVVTQAALHRSARYAGAVVFGLVTANLIWCAAVVLGLSALFELAPWLYRAIKLFGGAYLIYLGLALWRSRSETPSGDGSSVRGSPGTGYIRGLLTNLSNPKSVVYFGSIFALFLGPGTPAWVQATAVGIVIANTVLWYGTVATLFSRRAVQRRYVAIQRPINRAAGVLMAGFGGRLMLAHE